MEFKVIGRYNDDDEPEVHPMIASMDASELPAVLSDALAAHQYGWLTSLDVVALSVVALYEAANSEVEPPRWYRRARSAGLGNSEAMRDTIRRLRGYQRSGAHDGRPRFNGVNQSRIASVMRSAAHKAGIPDPTLGVGAACSMCIAHDVPLQPVVNRSVDGPTVLFTCEACYNRLRINPDDGFSAVPMSVVESMLDGIGGRDDDDE